MPPDDLGALSGHEGNRQRAWHRSGVLSRRGDRELQQITGDAASHYDVAFASIAFVDAGTEILVARCGIFFWENPRSTSFCAIAIQKPGEPLVVGNAAEDSRFADYATVCEPPFVRFYAGMSIMDRAGYALGALCVADPKPRTSTADVIQLMLYAREVERVLRR